MFSSLVFGGLFTDENSKLMFWGHFAIFLAA